MRIPTRIHAIADYGGGAFTLVAPNIFRTKLRRDRMLLRVLGVQFMVSAALTDWELGLKRRIPVPVHLALDGATSALLVAWPWLAGGRRTTGDRIAQLILAAAELNGATMTERTSSDRPAPSEASMPGSPTGVHNPIAGGAPRGEAGTPLAPPPLETPGPSVTAPVLPESDTERREWADENRPDAEILGTTDPADQLVAEEESAAAAEAASIGGSVPSETGDPAMDPVYQAGGGDEDGWEAAERDLIETASHGDGEGNPLRDALSPEAESDRSSAVYGEGDEFESTEVVEDPDEGPDDPGKGPNLPADR
jgi:hypothetical protein